MHLPSCLKMCFAYCAVFPKDYNFEKEEVVQLWLANDLLVHPEDNRPTGNIGEECFHELISRSLFQHATDNSFSMHDLVNDLARSVSGKYCLRLEDYNFQTHGTIARLNHFSYILKDHGTYYKFRLLEEATDLRTFLSLSMDKSPYVQGILSDKFLHNMLPKFKSLRTLSLSHYDINLPDSLKNGLKQLRFLDLSYTSIRKLPEWIYTLYNLQTLLLAYCEYLTELPEDLGKLINLCYLDISGFRLKKMPTNIGQSLRNLRLTILEIGKDSGTMIEMLGKFPEIGKWLELSGLENVARGESASMAKIKSKKQLERLTLVWGGNSNDSQAARDVLQSLEPPSTIKDLKIKGYDGTRFPDWLGSQSFCHVKSLILDSCPNCFELPTLGWLRSLESLEIVGMSKISALTGEMYGDVSETKPFPSLKEFRIKKMLELERWDIPAECEAFCSLKELCIIGCPKLVVVGQLPLKQFGSLETLEISKCDELVLSDGRLSVFDHCRDNQQQLASLRELKISALKNMKELWLVPDILPSGLESLDIRDCESLLTFSVDGSNLQRLRLEKCACLKVVRLGSLPMLEDVDISDCESLLTFSVDGSNLQILRLHNCHCLKFVQLGSFPMLKKVQISDCKSIEMFELPPRGIQSGGSSSSSNLASLTYLYIRNCEGLIYFPEGGLHAPNLIELNICDCKKLKSLPEQMESLLPSLRRLLINNCPEIECFPEGGLPSSIHSLTIRGCKKLRTRLREWDLRRLAFLTELWIDGFGGESFPNEDWPLPSTLWDKNLHLMYDRVLRHHDRVRNLYFTFLFVLGVVTKATAYLEQAEYDTGNHDHISGSSSSSSLRVKAQIQWW